MARLPGGSGFRSGPDRTVNQQETEYLRRKVNEVSNGAVYVKATGSTTARSLAERFSEVVNVKDFGAKGDGTTDDTAAIQAAINAAAANGGDVYLPPVSRGSSYLFSRLYFQYDATNNPGFPQSGSQSRPLRFRGVGAHTDLSTYSQANWARSLLVSTDSTGPALIVDGTNTGYGARQIEIEGITVIASNSTSVVLAKGANMNSAIRRCLFQQNGTGHGLDWDTAWMMSIREVVIQCGAFAMTTGSVGLRFRAGTAGGGPLLAEQVYVQRAYQQKTTGSITAGSATLTVASACDFVVGQALVIQGAGTGGDWLETTIDNIVGTTFTLHDAAVTTVSAQEVRHGGGFDTGIQIGALSTETGYQSFFSGFECRQCVSQWNRTGILIGGRANDVRFSHLWLEGNRKRGIFLTNWANNVRVEYGYINDVRVSDGEIVIDSATGGTSTYGLSVENVWFPTIHNYGIRFVDPTYTSGKIVTCRFTREIVGVSTTGSITSGTTTLVVADATGFANGQPIMIRNAGGSGVWLNTTISNVVGTTITVADAALATVTNQTVRHTPPGSGYGIYTGALTTPWSFEFNNYDPWSALNPYDDSSKVSWIIENDGTGTFDSYRDGLAFDGSLDGLSNMNWYIDSGSGATYKYSSLYLQHGGVNRWGLHKNNDATADFKLMAYTDAGAWASTPFQISRSTGRCDLTKGCTIGGGTTINKTLRSAKSSWAVGTVAAAGQVTTTATVTGAVTSNNPVVKVCPTSTLAAPLVAYGYVSGADTVTLVVVNASAAAVDGGTVTFNIEIQQ